MGDFEMDMDAITERIVAGATVAKTEKEAERDKKKLVKQIKDASKAVNEGWEGLNKAQKMLQEVLREYSYLMDTEGAQEVIRMIRALEKQKYQISGMAREVAGLG